MNWRRLSYFVGCILFLTLAFGVAYGVTEVPDPLLSELAILGVITAVLAFLMGRHSENVDEASGIISLDDDD